MPSTYISGAKQVICNSLDQNKIFVSESLVPLTQLAKWYKVLDNSLDQNKLFVSKSKVPLTQLAKWNKEPTKQFSEL